MLLVTLRLLEVGAKSFSFRITKSKDDQIGLIFIVIIFSCTLLSLYRSNFQLTAFCLMNKNEPICQVNWMSLASDIDCLNISNRDERLDVFYDDYAGFLNLAPYGINKYPVRCTLSIPNGRYRITDFDIGSEGQQPYNFITIRGQIPSYQFPSQFGSRNNLKNHFAWMASNDSGTIDPLINLLNSKEYLTTNVTAIVIDSASARLKMSFRRDGIPSAIRNPSHGSILILEGYSTAHILDIKQLGNVSFIISVWNIVIFCLELHSTNQFNGHSRTEAGHSGELVVCPLIIGSTLFVFGGEVESNQISQIYPWGIHRIGTLPFDFIGGRCHHFNDVVYLCFHDCMCNNCSCSGAKVKCHKRFELHYEKPILLIIRLV